MPLALCALARAQETPPPAAEPAEDAEDALPLPEPGGPPPILVQAEQVIVRPGVVLANANVLVERGRIVAVGAEVTAPEGARILSGRVVCAGFVDAWSSFAVENESRYEKSASPATRTLDGLDPFVDARLAEHVLAGGVTTVRVQAGWEGRYGGVGALVRLPLDRGLEECVLLSDSVVAVSAGAGRGAEDPFAALDVVDRIVRAIEDGQKYRGEWTEYRYELEEWQKEIAEAEAELEKEFKKAKKDREKDVEKAKADDKEFKEKKYKEDAKPKLPRYDADKEVLARIADGELPLVVEAHRALVLRDLLERTEPFDRLRLVIAGGTEAISVAKELAERRVPVIVAPIPRGAEELGDFDGLDLALAGRLRAEGVRILFGSGESQGEASRDLPLLAALTVGHGLEREAALAALTVDAASALDVGDRIGSIERGKDADLLVLDGEPLATTTRVVYVLSRGEVVVAPPGEEQDQ